MKECWNVMVPELSVSDFEKSFDFYTEILGFTVRHRRNNPDFAYLEHDKIQLMIEQVHQQSRNTFLPFWPWYQPPNGAFKHYSNISKAIELQNFSLSGAQRDMV